MNEKLVILNGKEILIDEECVDLVLYFNDIGLKTFMCCSGHGEQNFRIIFDNLVTDEDIAIFLKDKVNKYNHSMFLGKFVKWARVRSGEIVQNWMYAAETVSFAEVDYRRLKEYDLIKKDGKYE